MTETYSKPRQQAELAFTRARSDFLARDRALEEVDAVALARDEKTRRLREARLAKESETRTAVTAALLAKRSRKA
ncbi:hypothetical protein [Rhizobium oryzicola]|uniref:Transcriptional regulator n=1 Tax=Rhizobium oryzicola TaxID=1232668 RepID=A0ABT8SQF1_9HYPH|nr:hypothetical protein [Rhizobium oryzicola]MDO1580706.1 hypothetical protein [Rhizobium oryzicola]